MSGNFNVNQIVGDMERMRAMANREINGGLQGVGAKQLAAGGVPSFTDTMRQQIDKVANAQSKSKAMAERFELGDPNVDLVDVMIESQKSSIQFRTLVEVRNRLASAYKEIMDMPV